MAHELAYVLQADTGAAPRIQRMASEKERDEDEQPSPSSESVVRLTLSEFKDRVV